MADIYLDPVTGDMVVTNDFRFTTGLETVAQKLRLRMDATKGEYFADLNNGVDYHGEILGHDPSDERVSAIYRKVAIETPGVDRVTKMVVNRDGSTRLLSVDWEVLVGDEVISGSQDL